MTSVVGKKAMRAVSKLPFCYLCGCPINFAGDRTRDHVPPASCIAPADKPHEPLVLPAHESCNGRLSAADERLGQFLSPLHGRVAPTERRVLKYVEFTTRQQDGPSRSSVATPSVNLYGAVERWVRAFHAALYHEPMAAGAVFAIELPCEVISPVGGRLLRDSGRQRQRDLCEETIRRNRLAKTVDHLAAWNGKLLYDCVWEVTSLHAYCVFWIDFYDWRRLARISNLAPRDCVGFYSLPASALPPRASVGTTIMTPGSVYRFGL